MCRRYASRLDEKTREGSSCFRLRGGMNYLIRSERVRLIQHRTSVEIVEDRPSRWRPNDGDILLVTVGSNLQLEFSLFVKVLEIRTEEIRLDDEPGVRLVVKGELIGEGHNTLGQMMYSLTRVANFSRPGLNLRHHALRSRSETT